MHIRRLAVLAGLLHYFACASPNLRVRPARDVSVFNDTASHALSLAASPAAPTSALAQANQTSRQRQHPHSSHALPANHTTRTHHRTPLITDTPHPQQTVQPGDVRPHRSGGGSGTGTPHPAPSSRRGPHVARVFFEVLGGVAGLLVVLAVLRCVYIYHRTPRGVRAPTPEIGEVDRTLALLRNPWRPIDPLPPPPPPYQHAPDYDAAVSTSCDSTLSSATTPPRPSIPNM